MSQKVDSNHAGTIQVSSEPDSVQLYPHQDEAITDLSTKLLSPKTGQPRGLLVIPTGGGKTLTAVRWILSNFIEQGKKVLWIAHRHELLNQAASTFHANARTSLLPKRMQFHYRIVSGMHDRPVTIHQHDDLVIASKDSLIRSLDTWLPAWLKRGEEVLLVIDEAHHATAKTYRALIKALEKQTGDPKYVKLLGLTATPFRTSEKEEGQLGALFGEEPLYKVDLRSLIARGILAEPIFEELGSNLDMGRELTNADLKSIRDFDILPEQIARQIAESSERNKAIVAHYVRNIDKYGQLLVFAVNVNHAIQLAKLFDEELQQLLGRSKQRYAEYIVSGEQDGFTSAKISPEKNRDTIHKFREGRLKVLVNVNILTEGTDLPQIRTVFLTRPTMSMILMTQMIGRALRGEKAGGKKQAYIVSFIDNWHDKISWVSPDRWKAYHNYIDTDKPIVAREADVLVPIAKMEEFALMMHERIPALEALNFLERIPLGLYAFSYFTTDQNGDEIDRTCEVLVFNHTQMAYTNFVAHLDETFKRYGLSNRDNIHDDELEKLFRFVEEQYFTACLSSPGYRAEDVRDILRYYAQKDTQPAFLPFTNRDKCNLFGVAEYMFKQGMGGEAKVAYVHSLWNDDQLFWKVLFSNRKELFIRQLNLEIEKFEKLELGLPPAPPSPLPTVIPDRIDLADLPMNDILQRNSQHYWGLRKQVFAKHTDADGFIVCAKTKYRSKNIAVFQIDHITPRSRGGLTVLSNLQVLHRWVNREKGDLVEGYCDHCKANRVILHSRVVRSRNKQWIEGTCLECQNRIQKTLPPDVAPPRR